jgi:serine/threonine protein kinase, bacterial
MALPSGATFAGYTVARRLGSGVTGEVYLVQDPRSARWDALKVVSPAMSADGEFRRRFHSETPIATKLYHPHILEVHDRGEFEGQLWLAMDYINGGSAAHLMAERFPAVSPVGEVLAIITAVAGALDYAHQRGLLHRDVKPANILLSSPGDGEQRILLSDFGLARQLGDPNGGNVPAGTVAYAAPEVLTGSDTDGLADQYALAATAFHLLTGAPPVQQSDPVAAANQLLSTAPPRVSDQRPELARLDGVFARALARRPADRFESCLEFAEAANQQAGVSIGDRSPEAVFMVDYPAYALPEIDDVEATRPGSFAGKPEVRGTILQSAAGALARRLDDFSTANQKQVAAAEPTAAAPRRRSLRSVLLTIGAVTLLVGLFAVGIVVGRRTDASSTQTVSRAPAPSAPVAAPTTSTSPTGPVPLDGTYRLEVRRTKQTYDYTPDPQPPDVDTWWAFRSSCTPTACTAAATQLDDDDHTQMNSPRGSRPIVMLWTDGVWQSQSETVQFPCVGSNGIAQTQTSTLVLSLRPQPQSDLVGEETFTVETNECAQRSAVIRIPAVASRTGEVPPGIDVPDPATVTNTPTTTPAATAPTSPTTTSSTPGR